MYNVQMLACLMCRFQHVLCADFSTCYVQILACLMCRFQHVLCVDFSTSYVQILARLMCRFMRELAALAIPCSECLPIFPGDTFRGTELLGRCHVYIYIYIYIYKYMAANMCTLLRALQASIVLLCMHDNMPVSSELYASNRPWQKSFREDL